MNRFRPNLSKYFILIVTVLVFIFLINVFTEKTIEKKLNQSVPIGGSFLLLDSNNQNFDSKSIKRKKIIYFGYTFCPDVCPLDLTEISYIYDKFPNLELSIQPIFISLDPERDTPSIIKNYLENFNSNIIGLTGNIKQVDEIIKKFRIYKNKSLSTEDDYYTIDHTSLFYLLDKDDNYLTHFGRKNFSNEFTKYILSMSKD